MERDFDPYEERRSKTWLWILLLLLVAFIGGMLAMGYAVTHDARTARMLRLAPADQVKTAPAPSPVASPPSTTLLAPSGASHGGNDPEMASRLTTLEGKVDDIETQTRTATGNASRAEGLLVAFAARRALDRGIELGYIEGLLRQRFGGTQPQAVATILSASHQPVTLADLQNGLDAIGPQLSVGGAPQQSWWQSFRQELAGMVVVRRIGEPSSLPADRVARAERMLEAGQVDGALAEIARLPDHHAADKWVPAARRYLTSRSALDQIETAALLDPGTPPVLPPAPAPASTKPPVTPTSD